MDALVNVLSTARWERGGVREGELERESKRRSARLNGKQKWGKSLRFRGNLSRFEQQRNEVESLVLSPSPTTSSGPLVTSPSHPFPSTPHPWQLQLEHGQEQAESCLKLECFSSCIASQALHKLQVRFPINFAKTSQLGEGRHGILWVSNGDGP